MKDCEELIVQPTPPPDWPALARNIAQSLADAQTSSLRRFAIWGCFYAIRVTAPVFSNPTVFIVPATGFAFLGTAKLYEAAQLKAAGQPGDSLDFFSMLLYPWLAFVCVMLAVSSNEVRKALKGPIHE